MQRTAGRLPSRSTILTGILRRQTTLQARFSRERTS
jgi:hypothetical protein